MHKLHKISGHPALSHRLLAFASPAVVAVLVAAAPHLAQAADHKLCVRWRVDAIDRQAGTLNETTNLLWPARGVRLRVQDITGAILADTRTSTTDGCITYQDNGVNGQTTFRSVRIFYDTLVGTPAGPASGLGRIHVRGFFDSTEEGNNTDVSTLFQSVGFVSFPDNTWRADLVVGSGVAPMSISMASVSHTLHRVDTAMTGNKPAAPPLLKVILKKCQYTDDWSCIETNAPNNPGRLFLISDDEKPLNGSTRRKFVSSHEAGHWLDLHWGGEQVSSFASSSGANYTFEDSAPEQQALAPDCRFTWASNGGQGSSAHAMRSQEFQRGAVREAFAHFMALFAFNEASTTLDPVFQYYKTETASNVDASYPAEDKYFGVFQTTTPGLISVPHAYLQEPNGCNCAALGNCDGTSTQMQWMRAFWWYLIRDEPGGLKPTLTQLFGQLQSSDKASNVTSCGPTVDRCFGAVTAAIPVTFAERWANVGKVMGLGSDSP